MFFQKRRHLDNRTGEKFGIWSLICAQRHSTRHLEKPPIFIWLRNKFEKFRTEREGNLQIGFVRKKNYQWWNGNNEHVKAKGLEEADIGRVRHRGESTATDVPSRPPSTCFQVTVSSPCSVQMKATPEGCLRLQGVIETEDWFWLFWFKFFRWETMTIKIKFLGPSGWPYILDNT